MIQYNKINVLNKTQDDFYKIWCENYCNLNDPIYTFDNILVKFYPNMFYHAFFESDNFKKKDKSILSLNRCSKMLWIKSTLQDANAILKQGWLKEVKNYTNDRRVAIIKNNYIVIIRIVTDKKAQFVTAYEVNEKENLNKILKSPDWIKK